MCDERRIGVFLLKYQCAELVFSVWARKDILVTAFVLDHAEIGEVFTIVLRTLKVEKHQVLGVFHVIIHGHVIIKEFVSFFSCFSLLRLYRLKVALMVFRFDVFLTGGTSDFATMIITKTGTSYNTLTFLDLIKAQHRDLAGPASSLWRLKHASLLKNRLQSFQNFHSTREQFWVLHILHTSPQGWSVILSNPFLHLWQYFLRARKAGILVMTS